MTAGEIDYHFFIQYSWPLGADNAENFAFAESARQAIEPYVIATLPYINLATTVSGQTCMQTCCTPEQNACTNPNSEAAFASTS